MTGPVTTSAAVAGHAAAETGGGSHSSMLNKLRAGVLGANDGIVSVAAMVMGVAGATTDSFAILVAGVAGLSAGALSMAVGEYVSVSAQRDSERALLARERWELENLPDQELAELASLYEAKGLTPDLAHQVATQLTHHDALGALVPLLVMVLTAPSVRVWATAGAVVGALVLTGVLSARIGGARVLPAVVRVVSGGVLAMAITYAIGMLVGGGIA